MGTHRINNMFPIKKVYRDFSNKYKTAEVLFQYWQLVDLVSEFSLCIRILQGTPNQKQSNENPKLHKDIVAHEQSPRGSKTAAHAFPRPVRFYLTLVTNTHNI